MLYARQDFTFGSSITLQFISDNHAWHILYSFEELTEKSFRCLFVASALDENVEHVAILIHRSPEIVSLPTDGEEDLIHMPRVATTRATTAQFIGRGLTKFQTPLPHSFRGHDDPALCVVRSSTSRKLSEKRKYSHTAWLIISDGKRKPL